MKLLIMAESFELIRPMLDVAASNDYQVKIIGCKDEALAQVLAYSPDALIVACSTVGDITLKEMRKVADIRPVPVIVFTSDNDDRSINEAVRSGASAYVVDCSDPGRLQSLLGVARARFEEVTHLKQELEQTRTALQERKVIERAKGIIMKSRALSEEQAYSAMRKLAMNQNRRISDIAQQVIDASKVLV